MTDTDQFDEIEIKDDSTPVRHLNAQYRIPEPRKAGIHRLVPRQTLRTLV